MQIAGWHWLAASVAAVGAHAAIGLALLVEPPVLHAGGGAVGVTEIVLGTGLVSANVAAATPQPRAQAQALAQVPAEPRVATPADMKAPQETILMRAAMPQPAEMTSSNPPPTLPAKPTKTAAVRSETQTDPPTPPPRQKEPQAKAQHHVDTARTTAQTAALPKPFDGRSPAAGTQANSTGNSQPARASQGGEEAAKSAYISALQAWLLRHKQYPDRALARRQQGTATVYFVVNRMGQVRDYRLEQSSGHRLLDQEAAALVQRAVPMPRLPDPIPGHELPVIVPIEFGVR